MSAALPDHAACAEAAKVCACFNLRKASRAVSKLYDDTLQPIGLRSTQFVTILAVHLHEPIGLSPLAREMVADRSTLTRNLNILERGGLIRSKTAGARTRLYALTDKGRRVLADGIPLWEKAQTTFVEQLGAKQWTGMLTSLDAAVRGFEFIYPLHIGDLGGTAHSILILIAGLGLALLAGSGPWLWLSRRSVRRAKVAPP